VENVQRRRWSIRKYFARVNFASGKQSGGFIALSPIVSDRLMKPAHE
jgi:hypothetical protein